MTGADLEIDKKFMMKAIELASKSLEQGDAPFGSLITKGDELIAESQNGSVHRLSDHAEVVALHNAALALNTQDLRGYTLYTSCEPCPMCSFMIREYKISRVVYALRSPYMGGHSKWSILQDDGISQFKPFFNDPPEIVGGFMEAESQEVMEGTPFFMFGEQK